MITSPCCKTGALIAVIFTFVFTGFSQTVDPAIPNLNGNVYALVVQPDGKILIGGAFTKVGAVTRTRLARLNADGSLDTNFNASANNTVNTLAVQDDGAIVVGGAFTTLGTNSCARLGRLTRDGIVDASFNPGVSNTVTGLAIQADGNIVVGGAFTNVAGQARKYLCRVTKAGALDPNFTPTADNQVMSLAMQADGSIVVGGQFTYLNSQWCDHIGRLDTNGNVDNTFVADADGWVFSLAIQPDGSILAGGRFTNLTFQASPSIGRLTSTGYRDANFNSSADNIVYSLALQTDGKIIAGGIFSTLSGQTCYRIGRLNSDGTPDSSFNASASNSVFSVAIQSDGQVLVGGSFTNLSGQSRTNLARYSNTSVANQSLSLSGSTLTWYRSGTSPEVWRTQFDVSPDGNGWTSAGAGTHVAGGWQVGGLSVPANSSLRARGFTASGELNGSGGFLELLVGKPVVASAPTNFTAIVTSNALFSVSADGASSFQWLKNGTNLSDSATVSGAHTASLTLSNVFGADAANYSVIVSNASGAVTSVVARLTVLDPYIATPPSNQWINAGDTATFTTTVMGTPSFTYQWLKNGTNIGGATGTSLTITNAQRADIGNYSVIVSNNYGATTSSVAVMSVNLALCDSLRQDADAPVHTFALQPDGQILVGGEFGTLGGSNHAGLGRLHADGTLDTAFTTGINGVQYQTWVETFAVQPDGRILVGGSFVWLGSKYLSGLGRIDSSGVEDTGFGPMLSILGGYQFVSCLSIQTNQVLVAGCFDSFASQGHTNIARMDFAGTPDPLFKAGSESAIYPSQGRMYSMAMQPDGKILVGGVFTNLWGQTRTRIGRLNADGTLDVGFNPGANGNVECLAVQPDGKILVAGAFTQIGGQPRNRIARLDTNGVVEAGFDPGADAYISSLILQADGKILIGGAFANVAGQPCKGVGRLNPDGTIDLTFNPLADARVNCLAQQADGAVLVGGVFQQISGQPRQRLARLINPDAATQSLVRSNSTITWLRGGSSPEIMRAYFEASTDGTNWISLSDGARIAGGWQATNVSIPNNAQWRARGVVIGGSGTGSSWLVESRPGKPMLVRDSAFGIRTNHFGFNVSGAGGMPVVIESSTNLQNWVPVVTNQLGSDPFYFSDPNALDARRFYRARLP